MSHQIMTRRQRRPVAWIVALGIAFAQVAVGVHAGGLAGGDHSATAAQTHERHCAGVLGSRELPAPQGNACEVHCADGLHFAAAPDLPPVAVTSWAASPAQDKIAVDPRERDRSVLAAKSAAPPPLLQYHRFLI
jgi:hypothetical protein